MSDDIKDNLLSPSQWLRILAVVMYALICWVMCIVFAGLIIGQALFSLLTGKYNENLRHVAKISILYLAQVLQYMTCCSEEKPFPFSPLPTEEIEPDEEDTVTSAPTEEEFSNNSEPSKDDSPLAVEPHSEKDPSSSSANDPEDDVFADISFTTPTTDSDAAEGNEKPEGKG